MIDRATLPDVEAMEKLVVIVPNYNGEDLLPDCLRGLAAQTRQADEIVVVDDGSSDGSVTLIRTQFPQVRVIELSSNRGFPAAVNEGIRSTEHSLIALLNNDAIPDPDWLECLEASARDNPDHSAFGSRMVTTDRPPRIDSTGIALTRGFGILSVGEGREDGVEFEENREIFGPCGGAALYRRSLFDAIGLFDQSFVMYWEDVDIALRLQCAGKRALYVGKARVVHQGAATIGRNNARSTYYYHRNWRLAIAGSAPCRNVVSHYLPWLWTRFKADLIACRRGTVFSALRGNLGAFLRLPMTIQKHRIQSHATTPGAAQRIALLLREGSRLREEQMTGTGDSR